MTPQVSRQTVPHHSFFITFVFQCDVADYKAEGRCLLRLRLVTFHRLSLTAIDTTSRFIRVIDPRLSGQSASQVPPLDINGYQPSNTNGICLVGTEGPTEREG